MMHTDKMMDNYNEMIGNIKSLTQHRKNTNRKIYRRIRRSSRRPNKKR